MVACPDRQVALGRRPPLGYARRQRTLGCFGLAAQPLGQGQGPAGSGFPAVIRPHPVRPGLRSARERAFGAAAVAGCLTLPGLATPCPAAPSCRAKIPPACAPSGDAQHPGLSVACLVTQTYTGRRHKEWLLSRSTASRPAADATTEYAEAVDDR